MTIRCRQLPARGHALALLLLVLCLLAPATSRGEGLKPGDEAPLFAHLHEAALAHSADKPTSAPLLLLFIKQDDQFSHKAIEQFRDLEQRQADLFREIHVAVVLSRIDPAKEFDPSAIPPSWCFLKDADDAIYTAYHIIATPTAAIVGSSGRVIGFHPGQSPGLPRMVQRDLLMELRGTDAVRDSAPVVSTELKMGRVLAERGLWERALPYYRKAAEKEALPPEARLEMARILAELHQFVEARTLLDELAGQEGVCAARERLAALEADQGTHKAPSIE